MTDKAELYRGRHWVYI